jgi:hypothetical protein
MAALLFGRARVLACYDRLYGTRLDTTAAFASSPFIAAWQHGLAPGHGVSVLACMFPQYVPRLGTLSLGNDTAADVHHTAVLLS